MIEVRTKIVEIGHHITLKRVCVIIAIKKSILQILTQNVQKTSFALDNLCTND